MRFLTLVILHAVLGLTVLGADTPPNFILIVADDLGYGDLGCYGHPVIRTPNIDSMAREGMRFTDFYAASSICSPSRAALMTGRWPLRAGVSRVLAPVAKRGLKRSEITIAELLKTRDYATACVGKWHLGRLPKFLPTRQGFDSYFGLPYSNDMSRKTNPDHPLYRLWIVPVPPLPLMRDEMIIEREPDQTQLTRRYTEEAVQFIRASAGASRPFFLYLPHTFPHPPLHASERFAGNSERGLYGDVVEELDWSTGEIVRTVKDLGLDDQTLIIFTSDNGPWLAKKEDGGSPGPLREGKGSTWEGGLRVPFVARWPGKVPAGVTTKAFGTLMDLLPTFAHMAGAEVPDDRIYDGADISDVLLENAPGREALMYYWYRSQLRAVRKGPWKLHTVTNAPSNGTREATRHEKPLLFHLGDDPGERHDLASEHPDLVRELQSMIAAHRKSISF